MGKIKILSVRQPWAWLICAGYKDVENRTWKTDYRGELFIHAGKSFDWDAFYFLDPFVEFTGLVCVHFGIKGKRITMHKEEFGAVVGYCELTGCVRNADSIWAEPNCWNWKLRRQLELAPIPLKGQLGIFEADETIVEGL